MDPDGLASQLEVHFLDEADSIPHLNLYDQIFVPLREVRVNSDL